MMIRFLIVFWVGAIAVVARPAFNREYDHQSGNAVPIVSSVVVEMAGEIVLNREVPVGDKLRVQVYGENLRKVGALSLSTDHDCSAPVKNPPFSVLGDSQLYFEVTLDKYDTTYHICLATRKREIANYLFTVANEMDQLLITENAPFYHSKYFKCLFVGGIPCMNEDHQYSGRICLAHRLQLSLQNVMKDLPSLANLHFRFESMVNGLYAFYKSHACKRTASLNNYAELYKYKLLRLKAIIKLRWINSQYPAIHTFERNYFLLLFHLKHLQTAPEFKNDVTTISTSKGYYNELIKLDFKIYLLFMHDILRPISQLSEKLQKNLYSITNVQRDLESTISKLAEMQESYGLKIDSFLFLAECEKNGESVPCTIELFEEDDDTIKVSMPMRHFFDGAEPEEMVNFERRRMRVRLSEIRDTLIPAIIAELRSKFPEDPELMKALSALNPDQVPSGSRLIDLYVEKLRPLVARFGGPDQHIINECREVLKYANLNDQKNYLSKMHTSMEEFWEYVISYSNKNGHVEVGELKAFISKIMAVAPTSVIAERGFSSFFYTKSSRRSDLSETSLQDMMEILINGPPAETFDPFPAVNKWLAEGRHQSDHLPQIDTNTDLLPEPEEPKEIFLEEHEHQDVDLGEAEEEEEAGIADELTIFIDDVSEEDPIFPDNFI